MLGKLQEDSQKELASQLQDKAAQKKFITKLIVQGLLMLLEDSVEVRCRKCDEALVSECINDAVREYTQVIKDSTGASKSCKLTLDQTVQLPPAPNGDASVPSCLGGVVLACQKGAITIDNTIDSRLQLVMEQDSLKGAYVDPTVNLEIGLMRQRLRIKDQEIAQVREELQNAQFQPNGIQGKKLLDKCNHLQEENAEIARQLSEEKLQVLRIQLCAERQKRVQLRLGRTKHAASFEEYIDKLKAACRFGERIPSKAPHFDCWRFGQPV
ncbi:V-type proton ATPase subunit E (V-ATPase subunit E) (ClVE-1) (Vacuolar proton pump subunit E) [Durusdinium trenchii]